MSNVDGIEHFLSEGLVTDVIRVIREGKEAAVHLCRTNDPQSPLAAAKVYHPRERRGFKDASVYKEGFVIKERRDRVAIAKKTRYGRALDQGIWVYREWEMLETLHAAGVDVPRPIAHSDRAILMHFIGDEEGQAPQLREVKPDRHEARALWDRVLRNIRVMLGQNVVHADLSPYNVLYRGEGQVTFIDLPQAIDVRKNRNARELLGRDVERMCRYFERLGVRVDPERTARDLWHGWMYADLLADIPEEWLVPASE